nr:MAG TPA: hypothetical protein [Caudoviricetes sp.]
MFVVSFSIIFTARLFLDISHIIYNFVFAF